MFFLSGDVYFGLKEFVGRKLTLSVNELSSLGDKKDIIEKWPLVIRSWKYALHGEDTLRDFFLPLKDWIHGVAGVCFVRELELFIDFSSHLDDVISTNNYYISSSMEDLLKVFSAEELYNFCLDELATDTAQNAVFFTFNEESVICPYLYSCERLEYELSESLSEAELFTFNIPVLHDEEQLLTYRTARVTDVSIDGKRKPRKVML